MNISEQLANLATSRDLLLQRIKNGLAQDVAAMYGEMIDDITAKLLKSGKSSKNMTKTINDIKSQLKVPDVMDNMNDIAKSEINFSKDAYNSAIGADIFKNIPPESVINQIATTSLIEGATIGAWLKDLEASQAFDVERAIKLGMTLGETNVELAKRLQGTLDVSMRHAQSIVITGASAIANKARMDFYEANEDVIEGYQHLSVLDGKTSLICIARSGLKWDINKKPIGHDMPFRQPPLHFNSVAKGEKVLTINGYKSIEDIIVGDYVLTHKKRFKKVLNTMQKLCDNNIVRVINNDVGITIRVTDEHPLLVLGKGWVRSDAVEVGDKLYYNRYNMSDIADFSFARSNIGYPENYPPLFVSDNIPYSITSKSINMTSSVAFNNYFSGWNSKISNTIIKYKLMNKWNFKFIKKLNENGFTRKLFSPLNFNHRLKNFIFGDNVMNRIICSHSIRVPFMNFASFFSHPVSPMINTNINSFRNVIPSYNFSNFRPIKSFNPILNTPFANRAISKAKLSFNSTKRLFKPIIMLFDKILSPFNVSKVTHFYTSNINDISIVAYNDLVYNIEVEDDNSYLVNGVIVHNCRSSIVSILKYSKDFPKGTQSSDMGYLPKEYSFNDYLKLQSIEKQNDILGIGRADLWRSGKITLSDLVNQQGKTLSIKELLALDNAGVKVSSVKFDPTKGIIIGKGNTGNVYKYEDKVYKKYSEIEAKAYESLKSIDGVIDAKVKGDFIETDFYKFVITPESIEKMSSGAKAQIVSLVQDSRETINRTINEMSNRGISYSDKLQFVYDTKDKKVKLFDFSNAIIDETKKEDFRNNNLNHLSGFYRGLGLDDLADRVTNARIIRSAGLNDTSWLVYEMPKQVLSNSYPEIISKKIIDTLGETEKKSVYFQRDARDINYGKKFAIIEDAKKGKYVIFNDSLTDDEILKYELEVMIFD